LNNGFTLSEAHESGAVPIIWMAALGEWQRDWVREKTVEGVAGVQAQHGGASGVAFAWAMQILATLTGHEA